MSAVALLGALVASEVPTPAPDQWEKRIPLTLLVLGLTALVVWLMARGYRRRAARQGDLPELPAPPRPLGAEHLPALPVLYLGTTEAGRWLERIAAHGLGLPSAGRAHLVDAGVVVERTGAPALLLPAQALRGARLESGFLGKVVGEGGVLVLTWEHGQRLLDTGLRADDRDAHPVWRDAVESLVAHETAPGVRTLPGRADDPAQHDETEDPA